MFSYKLSVFAELIHQKDAEKRWRDDNGFNWSNATQSTLVKRLDELERCSPQEYRLTLPFVLMSLQIIRNGMADSNEIAQFLELPALEFTLKHANSSSFLDSLRVDSLVVPGWISPALSNFSREELNMGYLAVGEMLKDFEESKEDEPFEYEIGELLRMLEMALM